MILRFYAAGNLLVAVPGPRFVGQAPRYVGREFLASKEGARPSYAATKEPFSCDSDSDDGRRLAHVCQRDGTIFPADKATAEFCGVELIDVAFADGAWNRKPAKPVKEPTTNG